jgi:hypothetical protein
MLRRVHTGAGALLMAAGLAGLVTVACGPPGPGPGGPGGTTTTEVPEVPATTVPGTPPRPRPLVAVGDDGALVVVDPSSGARTRELARAPGGQPIRGVALAPGGATAYLDAGTGAAARVYAVPTDGSAAPTAVATGWSPEVSGDGAALAYLTASQVVVRDLATGAERAFPSLGAPSALAWSGGQLVWVRDGRQLVRLDLAAASPAPQAVPGATARAGERLYATLALPGQLASVIVGSGPDDTTVERLVVGLDLAVSRGPDGLTGGAQDRALDASTHWGVRADGHHNLRWSVGGGTGLIARGYTAADW